METDLAKLQRVVAKLLADNTFDEAIQTDAKHTVRQMELEDVKKAADMAADLAHFIAARIVTRGYSSPLIAALDAFVRAGDRIVEEESE
ncbi:MAG: hypothetical protein K8L97_33620 [Anaerolineae bacterium]|nr:hypothetical protein [Anaerolineae bacterium]